MQLYIDQRARTCRKLRDPDPICVQVTQIDIRIVDKLCWVELEDKFVIGRELDNLVLREGFRSHGQFFQWFHDRYGLPFRGFYIAWNPDHGELGGDPQDTGGA